MSIILEALQALSYLAEDLDSFKDFVIRNYGKKAEFTDELINTLVALDPTYKEGSNRQGTYADWIVRLYANKNLKEEDFGKVPKYLTKFDELKKKVNFPYKDIGRFKTLPDLAKALDEPLEEVIPTHRQEVRKKQNARRHADLGKEAELIYEDDKFEVWIPKTYAASCKLGADTQWCTATTESDENYKKYSEEGPLFIFISKKDPKEKYQFHFESEQFMDRYDGEIDFSKWDVNYLHKVFLKLGYKKYASNFAEDLVIPEGITEINSETLSRMQRYLVKSVTIPDSVKKIGFEAFAYCQSLESINIPNSVSQIGERAFSHCKSLTSINIPDSMIKIRNGVFDGCQSLESINIPDSVTQIGEDAFYGCGKLRSITIPNSVTEIDGSAFHSCTSLESITIPKSVKIISSGVFGNCTSLESIEIPISVTYIGNGAFSNCTSLKSITIPNSVTGIGAWAFDGCESLQSVTIPERFKNDPLLFYDCPKSIKYTYT